ncbi:hypothetical protein CsSME_00035049 [Camellia sinensis var. sinensis]
MFHIALVRIDQRDLGGPNCLTRAGTPGHVTKPPVKSPMKVS